MSQDDKTEYKYKEPLKTILMVVILMFVCGIGFFANLQIMTPDEQSPFFSFGEFSRLGVFFVAMLFLILFVARPLLKHVLAERK
ncbi:hypothetical protein [Shewanella woodyi]|uniref:hypothetical protein n=1 Tax=Shewanella woodyi TaxID=60961 RepID=UPI0007F8D9DE|nr:hypothetical protein [Shewanella woodyi]